MPVSYRIDRLRTVAALVVTLALAGPSLEAAAQQGDQPPKRQQTQQKPQPKPRASTTLNGPISSGKSPKPENPNAARLTFCRSASAADAGRESAMTMCTL